MGSEKMKSNFTETCIRFSHFLKERRSFGHLDAFKSISSSENEIKAKNESGPKNNIVKHMFSKNMEKNERMSLELFAFMNSSTVAGVQSSTKNMTIPSYSELPKSIEKHNHTTTTPNMTIFYGGKVLVFDELPEDKAREIMSLASRGTMSSHDQARAHIEAPHLTRSDVVVPQGASSLSDFPIARRVSLHRFMEKRKHRIATSAPYQLHNSSTAMIESHPQKLNMMRSLYEKQQLELKL